MILEVNAVVLLGKMEAVVSYYQWLDLLAYMAGHSFFSER